MTFFHRPVELVELLILYARVQFYMPWASDYRLNSKTDMCFPDTCSAVTPYKIIVPLVKLK